MIPVQIGYKSQIGEDVKPRNTIKKGEAFFQMDLYQNFDTNQPEIVIRLLWCGLVNDPRQISPPSPQQMPMLS